jgi:hypothetical protein
MSWLNFLVLLNTEEYLDIGSLDKPLDKLIDLSVELSSVLDDHNLESIDIWIYSHQCWDHKGACLSGSIVRLKNEIFLRVIKDLWNCKGLDNRRSLIVEIWITKVIDEPLRNIEVLPLLIL